MRSALATLVLLLVLCVSARATDAQTAPPAATLTVTVVDTTGAVLPGATVTVIGIEAGNKDTTIEPAQASKDGVAIIPRLAAGRTRYRRNSPVSKRASCPTSACETATTSRS